MTPRQRSADVELAPLLRGELEQAAGHAIELAIAGRYDELAEHALRLEGQLAGALTALRSHPAASQHSAEAVGQISASVDALTGVLQYALHVHRTLRNVAKSAEGGYGPAGMADEERMTRNSRIWSEA